MVQYTYSVYHNEHVYDCFYISSCLNICVPADNKLYVIFNYVTLSAFVDENMDLVAFEFIKDAFFFIEDCLDEYYVVEHVYMYQILSMLHAANHKHGIVIKRYHDMHKN
jgi:hypothetical protein